MRLLAAVLLGGVLGASPALAQEPPAPEPPKAPAAKAPAKPPAAKAPEYDVKAEVTIKGVVEDFHESKTRGDHPGLHFILKTEAAPGTEPESLLIHRFRRDGKTIVLVAGSDARGLMYALLDVADRVGWASPADHPFHEVTDTQESPFTPERALSLYTFNRAYWESRFHDETYRSPTAVSAYTGLASTRARWGTAPGPESSCRARPGGSSPTPVGNALTRVKTGRPVIRTSAQWARATC